MKKSLILFALVLTVACTASPTGGPTIAVTPTALATPLASATSVGSQPKAPTALATPSPTPSATNAPPTATRPTLAPRGQLPNPPPPAGNNTYSVTNPSTGTALYVQVLHPQNWDQQSKLPALVLVPGSSGDSSSFTRQPSAAQKIADAGFAIIFFDPDGRGKSRGTEDYDGFHQQDGLAAVLRFSANLPEVDSKRLGLVSYSYGITMASGALARYPDLPVRFLIDWEGPKDRNDTGGCDSSRTGHLQGVASCSDEKFWSEREAITFIGRVRVQYQRIQSERDHAQPDVTHAVYMVNAAVKGGVPWVRLNDMAPNQTFSVQAPPKMASEAIAADRESLIVKYAREMQR